MILALVSDSLTRARLSAPTSDLMFASMVGMAAFTQGAVEQPSKSLPPMEMVISRTAPWWAAMKLSAALSWLIPA